MRPVADGGGSQGVKPKIGIRHLYFCLALESPVEPLCWVHRVAGPQPLLPFAFPAAGPAGLWLV